MSARKLRLIIRPQARDDIHSILLYPLIHWGADQRRRYRKLLDQAIANIARYPEIGQLREDLMPGIRVHQVERHALFYRVTDNEIIISRILHANRDAAGKLGLKAGGATESGQY